MNIEFNDSYVLIIIAVFFFLAYCQNMSNCLSPLMHFCSYDELTLVDKVFRQVCFVYVFFLPFLYYALWTVGKKHAAGDTSYVVHFDAVLNMSSTAQCVLNKTNCNTVVDQEHTTLYKISYINIVFPYAVLAAINVIVLLRLIDAKDIDHETLWNEDFDLRALLVYEVLYWLHFFFLTFSLVAVLSNGLSMSWILLYSGLSFILNILIGDQARKDNEDDHSWSISMLLTIPAIFNISQPWFVVYQADCIMNFLALVFLTITQLAVIVLHSSAHGKLRVNDMIFFRIFTTIPASWFHCAMLLSPRSLLC